MVGTGLRFRPCWLLWLASWESVILVATGMEALNQSEVFGGLGGLGIG